VNSNNVIIYRQVRDQQATSERGSYAKWTCCQAALPDGKVAKFQQGTPSPIQSMTERELAMIPPKTQQPCSPHFKFAESL
jgi:hypothetical protein